ncbi:hypothetical protein, partial [Marinovum algicola]|uniref:hypothetical protein n=1 Tax=Marinovum algicola TaxID=42444 RepID=UPI001B8A998A
GQRGTFQRHHFGKVPMNVHSYDPHTPSTSKAFTSWEQAGTRQLQIRALGTSGQAAGATR